MPRTREIIFTCQCGREHRLKVEVVRGGHRIVEVSGEVDIKLAGQQSLFGELDPPEQTDFLNTREDKP